ncbi:hypothetical protein L1987_46044 [Smallanthus sonchifolius]|uniref:Uncharacterized protein n=1 Tax=Smallanthus sonchifolius TaxID=185202 RepID=A0ACB9FZM8_9ASTR|nr:hypothetical protein L1987_46044 [Smallanthus sonchifolius]
MVKNSKYIHTGDYERSDNDRWGDNEGGSEVGDDGVRRGGLDAMADRRQGEECSDLSGRKDLDLVEGEESRNHIRVLRRRKKTRTVDDGRGEAQTSGHNPRTTNSRFQILTSPNRSSTLL